MWGSGKVREWHEKCITIKLNFRNHRTTYAVGAFQTPNQKCVTWQIQHHFNQNREIYLQKSVYKLLDNCKCTKKKLPDGAIEVTWMNFNFFFVHLHDIAANFQILDFPFSFIRVPQNQFQISAFQLICPLVCALPVDTASVGDLSKIWPGMIKEKRRNPGQTSIKKANGPFRNDLNPESRRSLKWSGKSTIRPSSNLKRNKKISWT